MTQDTIVGALAHILLARVVTRNGNTPHRIIGEFVDDAMGRHAKRIEAINLIPR